MAKQFGSYLWATSRRKYVGKKHKGCIFCGISKKDPNVPRKELYRNDELMVVLNVFPYNRGHVEVVPRKHVFSITDLSEDELTRLFVMVQKVIKLLNKAYKPAGINVGINMGEYAGASAEHLHVQIVPRYKRETGFMEVTADTRVMSETVDQTLKNLKKYKYMLE